MTAPPPKSSKLVTSLTRRPRPRKAFDVYCGVYRFDRPTRLAVLALANVPNYAIISRKNTVSIFSSASWFHFFPSDDREGFSGWGFDRFYPIFIFLEGRKLVTLNPIKEPPCFGPARQKQQLSSAKTIDPTGHCGTDYQGQ